jgi:hypothetical protein
MADYLVPKAYKHIFTSPSSVEKGPKATRSGNARIHGMTSVTPASIAYVATQVRDALDYIMCYNKLVARGRLDSLSAPHLSFPEQILSPTRNVSITVFWSILKISMNNRKFQSFWCGGIGRSILG